MAYNLEPERSAWHEGEVAAQNRAGLPRLPRVIRSFMTEHLRTFFPQLPVIVIGTLDQHGYPFATLLRGEPGFISAPTPNRLEIKAGATSDDQLARALQVGATVGLIGIDFATRRRNRINGVITTAKPGEIAVAVDQAFGNCPKYITPRASIVTDTLNVDGTWSDLSALDERARDMIRSADTFFVASSGALGDRNAGIDVSHRGGRAGFVSFAEGGALTIPDYVGNNYFNTLGNLVVQPRCGLLFLDFQSGELLQLRGMAKIDWQGTRSRAAYETERSWTFDPQGARRFAPRIRSA